MYVAILTYMGYAIIIVFGHLRDLLRKWKIDKRVGALEPHKEV